MKIILLESIAGLDFVYPKGKIVEHPNDKQCHLWIKKGIARQIKTKRQTSKK